MNEVEIMSVPKHKRKPSQFEVFHHLNRLRKDITDLLLRDFGFDFEKAEKRLEKRFGGKSYQELDSKQQAAYERLRARWEAFDEWFIADERQIIVNCLRAITREVYIANSIYPADPTRIEELAERRIHQERAIGYCFTLAQELQYAIETLPVDMNSYTRFGEAIQTEINLIKGWRKSDKKFKGATSDSASNFANCNNNGNANYNNASNSNGVRPDFPPTI
jgi:hypothetical protein